jgi:hypothetical protein
MQPARQRLEKIRSRRVGEFLLGLRSFAPWHRRSWLRLCSINEQSGPRDAKRSANPVYCSDLFQLEYISEHLFGLRTSGPPPEKYEFGQRE